MVSYAYDLVGHRIGTSDNSAAITPPAGGSVATMAYSYDAMNRLAATSFSPVQAQAPPSAASASFSFGYNAANQRVSQSATDNSFWAYPAAMPSTVSYTSNSLNQYAAVGSVTPTYDGNGNLTYDGNFTYCYDAENRLISAISGGTCASPATTVAAYAYDAQGARKSKTVGSTTTVTVTDPQNRALLDYDGTSGAILRWYAFGLGSNDALSQANAAAGTRTTFIPDIQGSIVATLDSSTGALTKAGYLPYGTSPATPITFGYTGQRIDPETNGLYYYRARHYSPAWGRFMQPDPIGYTGGANLYAYVNNDPLNFTDPSGFVTDAPSDATASKGSPPGAVLSDASPDPVQSGAQYAQAGMALCGLGPAGCGAGAFITGVQALGVGAVGTGALILSARPPQDPQPITNPPQPAPDIPEGWQSSPSRSGGGTVYYPPGQSPDTGESIRVMPPGSSPVPGLENGYWVQTNKNNQPINPATGRPGEGPGDTHVPLPPPGE